MMNNVPKEFFTIPKTYVDGANNTLVSNQFTINYFSKIIHTSLFICASTTNTTPPPHAPKPPPKSPPPKTSTPLPKPPPKPAPNKKSKTTV